MKLNIKYKILEDFCSNLKPRRNLKPYLIILLLLLSPMLIRATIYYTIEDAGADNEPVYPTNNSRLETRHINFTYYINKTDGVHNLLGIDDYVVGNWWFEENASDVSGNGNDGLVYGAVNTSGIVGGAYDFDGDGDYITGDLTQILDYPFTISAWFRTNDVTTIEQTIVNIVDTSNELIYYGISMLNNVPQLVVRNTVEYKISHSSVRPVIDEWHYFVGVFTSDTSRTIYVDSIDGGTGTDNVDYNTNVDAFSIGNLRLKFPAEYANGTIDEVTIWNRSLSALEINELYNRTLNIANRSLLLNVDDTNYEVNTTDLDLNYVPVGVNSSINVSFPYGTHNIYWKIATREINDSSQWNSSEYYLEINNLVTQSNPNIGAHAYLDRNYVVGQWRFEDRAVDETGLNNGTVTGAKWCPDEGDSLDYSCSGRIGRGYSFDGKDDTITIGTTYDRPVKSITISTWINVDKMSAAGNNHEGIVMDANLAQFSAGYGLNLYDGNKVRFWINLWSDNFAEFSPFTDTLGWHHIVGVYDGANIYVYVDGVVGGITDTYSDNIDYTGATGLQFGKGFTGSNNWFNGSMDEVTIWNRSLSAEEIAQLYYSSAESYNSTFTIQDISASNNNTNDLDNDTIKYIYNWYVNNVSMAVLNMPFEAVNNGSEMNFSKDYSGNDNHGSVVNADWNRTGGVDGFGAYEFDGVNDYIQISNDTIISNGSSFTISVWTKGTKDAIRSDFVSAWSVAGRTKKSFVLYEGSGKIQFALGTAITTLKNFNSNVDFADNEWQHIVGVFNDEEDYVRIYINGVYYNFPYTGYWTTAGQKFSISASATYPFNGTIDEFMIFNRSLSAEQIKALYLNQSQTIKSSETNKGESWKAEIFANDGYGDSIAYNTSEIIIDSVTLDVTSTTTNLSKLNTNNINFTWFVDDNEAIAGVNNCSILLDSASANWEINSTRYNPEVNTNYSFNLTLEDDEYQFVISCWDKDNEQTNSSIYNVTIDTTFPLINYTDPTPTNNTNQSFNSIYINYSITETNDYYSFIDYDNSLKGWWRFEENPNDETGLNNGTVTGATNTTAGKFGKAYEFDGVNDYITIPDSNDIDLANGGSVFLWFYQNQNGNYQTIIDHRNVGGNGWEMEIEWSQRMYIAVDATTTCTIAWDDANPISVPSKKWHHIGFTWNGSDLNAYLNGNKVSTTKNECATGDISVALPIILGAREVDYTHQFNGTIDEVLIFNRSLTTNEIYALYNSSRKYNNYTSQTDGEHSFKAYTVDIVGNKNQTNKRIVTIDATKPIINLQAPNNLTNQSTSYINFTYNVTDAIIGTETCSLWLNNGSWYLNSTDSSITETVNQTFNLTIEDGNYLWKVECNDSLGNSGNSSIRNVTIDTTPPTITLDEPLNNSDLVGTDHDLRYTPNDVTSGLLSCTLIASSEGTIFTREQSQPVSGTQILEEFGSVFFYSLWEWDVECYDYSGNSYTTRYYFTTSESLDMAEGGTSTGSGDGTICPLDDNENPQVYNLTTGVCEPTIIIKELKDEIREDIQSLPEKVKEIVEEAKESIKDNKIKIIEAILIFFNLVFTYLHFNKIKVRYKIHKEESSA